ncbi:MAG: cation-translocating P-type ATPase [Chlorobiaceae bacterium]|nr:cation-translocating P-type ATPase [Chlorobiaceae bacterium]
MNQPFYSIPLDELFRQLETSSDGISSQEAVNRLARQGLNTIEAVRGRRSWQLLMDQFRNVLILTLLVATVLSAFLGHGIEAVAILIIILFAVLLGFFQEFRAEKAIDALRVMAAPNARVIRDGHEQLIPASGIVSGDLILMVAGDRIPADARLVESINLRIEESSLTGESVPSEKESASPIPEGTGIGDRSNMVFAGTSVVYGRGRAIVTRTGMGTEIGRIAGMLQRVETEKTPLQKNLDKVGASLAKAALVIVLVIVALGIVRGQPLIDILIFGIALAVAVVPEALPAVVTISLALGVQRMTRRHALMRRLPAVETLGSTTVICSDKTGTLTRDEMTVRSLYADGMLAGVTGSGYRPEGSISIPEGKSEFPSVFMQLLQAGVLCNDANLEQNESGEWLIRGDPTEGALIVAARKGGLDERDLRTRYPRIDEQPFSSETRRMVTVHRNGDAVMAIVKGAPESILPVCTRYVNEDGLALLDDAGRQAIMIQAENMGREALRVLAIARSDGAGLAETDDDLVFLGFAGMIDPPRSEARDAIRKCFEAGIRPVMITGDHPVTAEAIARELGILVDGRVVSGAELEGMDDTELRKMVGSIDVFARVAPEHKLRIVEALQSNGEIVAMTGDGVNDAPALKKADIGISMGINGTDVSREASAMTLTDDNFSSIVAAVEEGRGIYDNIRKYLTYLLSSNIGELGLMAGATLLGLPLPLTAVQILYVNLATDGLPALALAVDPAEPGIMKRSPYDPKQGIFTRPLIALMMTGGIWSTIVNLSLFQWARYSGRPLREAMTMTFVSLVLIQFFKAYNFRSDKYPVFKAPFANRWLNLAILWELLMLASIVSIPVLMIPFSTFPMSFEDWLIVIICTLSIIPVIEVVKWFIRKGLFGLKA